MTTQVITIIDELINVFQQSKNKNYDFWENEAVPILKSNDKIDPTTNAPIEIKTLNDVNKQSLPLPLSFNWIVLDLNTYTDLDNLYNLLSNHWNEDDEGRFRYNYSKQLLKHILVIPNYKKQWHLGIQKTNKLCAFISAIPSKVQIYDKRTEMVTINILCVAKQLSDQGLEQLLVGEITRRINIENKWQGIYRLNNLTISKPVFVGRYWHRTLNPEKLIKTGFSTMNKRMTIPRLRKLYKLPDNTQINGLRQMVEYDCTSTYKLFSSYLNKFSLHYCWTLKEFEYYLLRKENVKDIALEMLVYDYIKHNFVNNYKQIPNDVVDVVVSFYSIKFINWNVYSYVVEDEETGKITDLISFYKVICKIVDNDLSGMFKDLKIAYSLYNVATSVSMEKLMADALILAKNMGFDVFSAYDIMENEPVFKELKFKIGDGHIQYHLYNWKCQEMVPKSVGLVIL
eukprot:166967_1